MIPDCHLSRQYKQNIGGQWYPKPLKERREYLCLNFARKCLKNKKMKYLFPPNDSKHLMQPRKQEHFKILFARTKRYKESPIIYMQTILNKEIQRKIDQDKLWNIWIVDLLLPVNPCVHPSYCASSSLQ